MHLALCLFELYVSVCQVINESFAYYIKYSKHVDSSESPLIVSLVMNPNIVIHALYLVFEAENIIFLIICFSNHFPVKSKDIKEATELSDGRVYVRLSWNTFAVVERYSRAIWC